MQTVGNNADLGRDGRPELTDCLSDMEQAEETKILICGTGLRGLLIVSGQASQMDDVNRGTDRPPVQLPQQFPITLTTCWLELKCAVSVRHSRFAEATQARRHPQSFEFGFQATPTAVSIRHDQPEDR